MRRNHRHAANRRKVPGNRHREGRALFRISSRSQLVQQHQRLLGRSLRNEINIGDVSRERRKILFNRLIVANICQHRIERGQLRPIGWNRNARLRHQRQQSNGFEGDRLSASVGASDHQLPPCALEFHTHRNDARPFELEIPL